jgi:hypothetical protein
MPNQRGEAGAGDGTARVAFAGYLCGDPMLPTTSNAPDLRRPRWGRCSHPFTGRYRVLRR